jgi:hypothetical protein
LPGDVSRISRRESPEEIIAGAPACRRLALAAGENA